MTIILQPIYVIKQYTSNCKNDQFKLKNQIVSFYGHKELS